MCNLLDEFLVATWQWSLTIDEIDGQSIILNEIRPSWSDPTKMMTTGYAKATFVKNKEVWRIYWKRADNEWHLYKPFPVVDELKHFLKLVDDDVNYCFKG